LERVVSAGAKGPTPPDNGLHCLKLFNGNQTGKLSDSLSLVVVHILCSLRAETSFVYSKPP